MYLMTLPVQAECYLYDNLINIRLSTSTHSLLLLFLALMNLGLVQRDHIYETIGFAKLVIHFYIPE